MAKVPKSKNKTFYYRRANFGFIKEPKSLEAMLKSSLTATESVRGRTFAGGQGTEVRCSHYKEDGDKGLFLQITTYTPDQPTSTIEKSADVPLSIVDEEEAPIGKHFVDGEAFVFVNGDHVIFCLSTARESIVLKYFQNIIEDNLFVIEAKCLELDPIANVSKLKMIQKEGIKDVIMDCSLYDASLERLNSKNKTVGKFFGKIAADIQTLISTDDTLQEIDDRENVNIKISLSFDGKRANLKESKKIDGFGEAGKEHLSTVAKALVNDSDSHGFKILTNFGNTITADEIRVSDSRKVDTFGKSLKKQDAWDKLYLYHIELKSTGVLKQ